MSFGDPAFALMAKDQRERLRLYPWLQNNGQYQYSELSLKHTVIGPTHQPIEDISQWLNTNGARWDDRFQLIHETGPALVVFDLRKYKPAAEVAA